MSALDFNAVPQESIAELKARADIVAIIGAYAKLKQRGHEWTGCCPLHADKTPSFKVNAERQSFYCFGCGAKGDVLDFVMAAEHLALPAAIERLQELLGGARRDPVVAAARAARIATAAALEARELARRVVLAQTIFRQSEPLTRCSPELPVRYLLERRRITQWQPWSLRWHPACPWGPDRVGCIVVAVSNVEGEVTGIWRIRPILDGKIERRGLGSVLGGCARVVDDAALSTLAIAEGVEDALSAWVLLTYPCWAALSTAGMAALELPTQFEQILICADADEQGRRAAQTLAGRMRAEGRQVRVLQPTAGKDANDVLRARRAA